MRKTHGFQRYIRNIYVLKYVLWKIQEYRRHHLNYYKVLNPSIIDYKGKRFIAFRDYIPKNSYICIGELKGEEIFNVKRILGKTGVWSAEDPRFFIYKDKLHISYVVGKWGIKAAPGGYSKMAYCELNEELSVSESHIFDNFEGIQKNWLFFESPEKKLYAITHVHNQKIFDIQNDMHMSSDTAMKWSYGEEKSDDIIGAMRGGSTPILKDGVYYSFFHVTPVDAKTGHRKMNYCYEMGCYTFESSPPFKVLSYTPKPLFIGNPYVLPNGAIFENEKWLVSCGIDDSSWKLLTFDHKILLENMVSV